MSAEPTKTDGCFSGALMLVAVILCLIYWDDITARFNSTMDERVEEVLRKHKLIPAP